MEMTVGCSGKAHGCQVAEKIDLENSHTSLFWGEASAVIGNGLLHQTFVLRAVVTADIGLLLLGW